MSCLCDWPTNAVNGFPYPELYMMVVYGPSYQIDPYLFSFHPSDIEPDPGYPNQPIDNGIKNVDRNGVEGGSAYLECDYCIVGTTGISSSSAFGDDPGIEAAVSVSEVPPSSDAIAALDTLWGATVQEEVDLEITASLEDCVWTGVLVSANGKYSVQSRLWPGVSEVVGNTSSSNFCTQLADLKTLASGMPNWYMLSAVQAHENVHVSRLYPCINAALTTFKTLVRTLHVPATGQTKAQAILQLKALTQHITIKGSALTAWAYYCEGVANSDHATGAACDIAEKGVIIPVANGICSTASSSSWGSCSNCPFSF